MSLEHPVHSFLSSESMSLTFMPFARGFLAYVFFSSLFDKSTLFYLVVILS